MLQGGFLSGLMIFDGFLHDLRYHQVCLGCFWIFFSQNLVNKSQHQHSEPARLAKVVDVQLYYALLLGETW